MAKKQPRTVLIYRHRVPFDRLLIVQAMKENACIVSADKAFDHYDVTRQW